MIPFTDSVIQQAHNHMMDQSDMSEAQQGNLKAILGRIDTLLEDYARQAAQIRSNGKLSKEGQESELADLRQTAHESLSRISDAEAEKLDKRMVDLQHELRPQPPATDAVLQFMVEKEIRERLQGMDELELRVLYEDLAVTGRDDMTMLAIENAPASFPLISDPAILDAGKRGRGARQSPESAKILEQITSWRGILGSAVASARAQIGGVDDDPVAKVAHGDQ